MVTTDSKNAMATTLTMFNHGNTFPTPLLMVLMFTALPSKPKTTNPQAHATFHALITLPLVLHAVKITLLAMVHMLPNTLALTLHL